MTDFAEILLFFTALLVALCFVRLVLGPSRSDRLLSLDLLAIVVMAGLSVLALQYERALFVDVILALSLISFVSTLAFCAFMTEKKS
jgi:multicomponent Na+:H+ antiporter subunit F